MFGLLFGAADLAGDGIGFAACALCEAGVEVGQASIAFEPRLPVVHSLPLDHSGQTRAGKGDIGTGAAVLGFNGGFEEHLDAAGVEFFDDAREVIIGRSINKIPIEAGAPQSVLEQRDAKGDPSGAEVGHRGDISIRCGRGEVVGLLQESVVETLEEGGGGRV